MYNKNDNYTKYHCHTKQGQIFLYSLGIQNFNENVRLVIKTNNYSMKWHRCLYKTNASSSDAPIWKFTDILGPILADMITDILSCFK